MQKLTKLTYMIAAVIISNIVYAISNLKSVAFAALNTSDLPHCIYTTSIITNLGVYASAACTSACSSAFPHLILVDAAALVSNGNCLCAFSYQTFSYAQPVFEQCGTLYSCSDSLNPYVSAEVNTAAWAGYVVATGGLRKTILGIECCPGAGTVGGQVAAHLGMGSNVRGADNVVAHATPYDMGITGCYVQAQDTFYDPSGTWVYDSDCPYYPE